MTKAANGNPNRVSNPTDQPGEVKPRSRAEIFAALIQDQRISHGAFRLFHLLRDHQNPRTGACYPGRRRQMKALGSDHHCLKRWTAELVSAGWLCLLPVRNGEVFRYELLDGQGQPWWKSTTDRGVKAPRNLIPLTGDMKKNIGLRLLALLLLSRSRPVQRGRSGGKRKEYFSELLPLLQASR